MFTTEGFSRGFFHPLVIQQVAIDISLLENRGFYKSFPCFTRSLSIHPPSPFASSFRSNKRGVCVYLPFDRLRYSDVVSCQSFVSRLIGYCLYGYWSGFDAIVFHFISAYMNGIERMKCFWFVFISHAIEMFVSNTHLFIEHWFIVFVFCPFFGFFPICDFSLFSRGNN